MRFSGLALSAALLASPAIAHVVLEQTEAPAGTAYRARS
jgi:hypothetical protein